MNISIKDVKQQPISLNIKARSMAIDSIGRSFRPDCSLEPYAQPRCVLTALTVYIYMEPSLWRMFPIVQMTNTLPQNIIPHLLHFWCDSVTVIRGITKRAWRKPIMSHWQGTGQRLYQPRKLLNLFYSRVHITVSICVYVILLEHWLPDAERRVEQFEQCFGVVFSAI